MSDGKNLEAGFLASRQAGAIRQDLFRKDVLEAREKLAKMNPQAVKPTETATYTEIKKPEYRLQTDDKSSFKFSVNEKQTLENISLNENLKVGTIINFTHLSKWQGLLFPVFEVSLPKDGKPIEGEIYLKRLIHADKDYFHKLESQPVIQAESLPFSDKTRADIAQKGLYL